MADWQSVTNNHDSRLQNAKLPVSMSFHLKRKKKNKSIEGFTHGCMFIVVNTKLLPAYYLLIHSIT